jgi:hypothetical protein
MSAYVAGFVWTGAILAAAALVVIVAVVSRRRRLITKAHDPEMQQSLNEIQNQIDAGRRGFFS